jgi:hypothetical protein
MNTLLAKSTLAAAIALTIVACAPEGGSLAGIGGSGYVSSGSVSGFGSVFVNGVEFETGSATYDIDGESGSLGDRDLAIGMVVRVSGTINDDGISGTASHISFDDELQGPVSAPAGETNIIYDVDGVTGTFTVLGVKVVIDSSSTSFDVDGDLTVTTFDFNTIAIDNNVEISGFFDMDGTLLATRIELKDITFDPDSIVEVEGVISNLSGTTFDLGTLLMVNASAATFDDLPDGLVDNQLVEVKGTYDTGSNTITATKVEGEDNSPEDTDEIEIEGIITNYDAVNLTFNIGEIVVDISNLTLDSAIVLSNDIRIEVEGAVVNGILIATELELEGGDIKVHAMVSSVDKATNSFKIEPVPGQEITVTITSSTQLEADGFEDAQYTLTDLFNDPGFVEVRGLDDGEGGITALEVDVKGSDIGEVIVQGFATAVTGDSSGGTMTVIGVTFNFDDGTTTDFEIDSDVEGNEDTDMKLSEVDDLIDAIKLVAPQLVKIVDKKDLDGNPVGDADEIEIE